MKPATALSADLAVIAVAAVADILHTRAGLRFLTTELQL